MFIRVDATRLVIIWRFNTQTAMVHQQALTLLSFQMNCVLTHKVLQRLSRLLPSSYMLWCGHKALLLNKLPARQRIKEQLTNNKIAQQTRKCLHSLQLSVLLAIIELRSGLSQQSAIISFACPETNPSGNSIVWWPYNEKQFFLSPRWGHTVCLEGLLPLSFPLKVKSYCRPPRRIGSTQRLS